MKSLFSFVMTVMFFMKQVAGSGHIEIRLVRYNNEDGEGSNGNCCEGWGGYCRRLCDHYFIVCLDRASGNNDVTSCPFGKIQTGVVRDRDTIDFGNDIGGTPNPLKFAFIRWNNDGVKIKVEIWDDDTNNDDHVDNLNALIRGTPDQSQALAVARSQTLSGRTRLSVNIKKYCDPSWFGQQCAAFCEPQDDPQWGHYTCNPQTGDKICHSGWAGTNCTVEVDECQSSPCMNGGRCVDAFNQYRCDCTWPYTGARCERNSDPCTSSPCDNGGTCSSSPHTMTCSCVQGYTGTTCDADINECDSNPCLHGGTCIDVVNGYRCTCAEGYTGSRCAREIEYCQGVNCQNGGSCVVTGRSGSCVCPQQFTGARCESRIDPCLSSPCGNGGQCVTTQDGFLCRCTDGFRGRKCNINIDECASNPCQHGSTCIDDVASYSCACAVGYEGTHCQISRDPCLGINCQNGGQCVQGDHFDFSCECDAGFTGLFCEFDIDECVAQPCEGHGVCINTQGGYHCECPPEYVETGCDVSVTKPAIGCVSSPCVNNSTCEVTQDHNDSFVCLCADEYFGKFCEFEDRCLNTVVCFNNGTCNRINHAYSCECVQPWIGDSCEICSCGVHGICSENSCDCEDGWFGSNCDMEQSICDETLCNSRGECIVYADGTRCKCSVGFSGDSCEVPLDPCSHDPCKNGAHCMPDGKAYTCECIAGYTGVRCESKLEDGFPSGLMFVGLLSEDEKLLFIEQLEKVVSTSISKENKNVQLNIKYEAYTCQGKDGQNVTVFEFYIFDEKEEIVPYRTIVDAVNNEPDILPRKLYNGTECVVTHEHGRVRASRAEESTVWQKWKFVILGVVGTVLIVGAVAVLVVMLNKRRSETWSPEVAIGVNNPLFEAQQSLCSVSSSDESCDVTKTAMTSLNMPLPAIPQTQ